MERSDKMEQCTDPSDPRRCQGVNATGQCNKLAMEGSKFCVAHGGSLDRKQNEETKMDIYRLTKYQARFLEQQNHPELKNLRAELAILRILMEEKFNHIAGSDNPQLMLLSHSGSLSDLALKIERIITSIHKLDLSLGNLLDKASVVQLCNEIIAVIAKHVTDPEIIVEISNEIMESLKRVTDPTQKVNFDE